MDRAALAMDRVIFVMDPVILAMGPGDANNDSNDFSYGSGDVRRFGKIAKILKLCGA